MLHKYLSTLYELEDTVSGFKDGIYKADTMIDLVVGKLLDSLGYTGVDWSVVDNTGVRSVRFNGFRIAVCDRLGVVGQRVVLYDYVRELFEPELNDESTDVLLITDGIDYQFYIKSENEAYHYSFMYIDLTNLHKMDVLFLSHFQNGHIKYQDLLHEIREFVVGDRSVPIWEPKYEKLLKEKTHV